LSNHCNSCQHILELITKSISQARFVAIQAPQEASLRKPLLPQLLKVKVQPST
jgi:hypothetical protein